MKITDIRIKSFRTNADRWDVGHALPMPKAALLQTVLAIETDTGVTGYYFGGGSHGGVQLNRRVFERGFVISLPLFIGR